MNATEAVFYAALENDDGEISYAEYARVPVDLLRPVPLGIEFPRCVLRSAEGPVSRVAFYKDNRKVLVIPLAAKLALSPPYMPVFTMTEDNLKALVDTEQDELDCHHCNGTGKANP